MKMKSKKAKTKAKAKKKAAPARSQARPKRKVLKVQIPIKPDRSAVPDVEGLIREKLQTLPTDVFTKNDEVILEIEKFGWKPYP